MNPAPFVPESVFEYFLRFLTTDSDLKVACALIREQLDSNAAGPRLLAVDTEFVRVRTYRPQLCLIQMEAADSVYVVDCLAGGLKLAPVFALLHDRRYLKIFHAGEQDVEIIYHHTRKLPSPLVDTQVLARACGFGDQVGYDKLVKELLGVSLEKASQFTAWQRRPLTRAQLAYAGADVAYLPAVYRLLKQKVVALERWTWCMQDIKAFYHPSRYQPDDSRAWRRVKGLTALSRNAFAAGVALASWRERAARRLDVPRPFLLADRDLLELAKRPHARGRVKGLAYRLLDAEAQTELKAILADTHEHKPPVALEPAGQSYGLNESQRQLYDILKIALHIVARENAIAAGMIAGKPDLAAFARGDQSSINSGGRYQLFGKLACRIRDGEYGLAMVAGKCMLVRLKNSGDNDRVS